MTRLEGLIFDLDGTLVDSAPDLHQALNLTLRAHGQRDLTLEETKPMLGDGMVPMLARAFKLTGSRISDQEAQSYFQEFLNHYRHMPPAPEQLYAKVHDTLVSMQKRGIALGLCTNKQEESTHRLLKSLNIAQYFGFVAGGDTFAFRKPHPDHVTGVIDHLMVSPKACVMIGDSQNDVFAAKAAGVPTIVVTHGYGVNSRDLPADAFIDGFDELAPALGRLGFVLY